MENDTTTLENSLSWKVKCTLTIWYRHLFLGIHLGEMKAYVQTKTCTWKFVAALCVIAKDYKQLKCSSTGERINKLYYTHTLQ